MVKNKILLPIFCLLVFSGLKSQVDETLFGKQGLRLTGAWLSADQGVIFFDDDSGLATGGFIALEFNKNMLVGFGGWQTSDYIPFATTDKFNMQMSGLFIGFLPNSHRVLHPKFSFFVGSGEVITASGYKDSVFNFKPAIGGEVNLFRWFKLSLEGSYAFVSDSDIPQLQDGDLSSFTLELKLRFGWSWKK
jgi:hypothetical protein